MRIARTGAPSSPNIASPLSTIALLLLAVAPGPALALSLSITQFGGTALNGVGLPGDTIEVAIDVSIDADEVVTSVFPALVWDEEGGNVLDVRAVGEPPPIQIGDALFGNINGNSLLTREGSYSGEVRSFTDPQAIPDDWRGQTIMNSIEFHPRYGGDDDLFAATIANGLPGPLDIRIGYVRFELIEPGTTTLGFFLNEPGRSPGTLVTGADVDILPNDEIEFSDVPISAVGFAPLQIVVIPEPSTAMLVGLGLAVLARRRDLQTHRGDARASDQA